MATKSSAAKKSTKAAAKRVGGRRPAAKQAQPATTEVVGEPADASANVYDVRPCPRCGTTDRVVPAGGEPPMLVHFGCGYTFPVEA